MNDQEDPGITEQSGGSGVSSGDTLRIFQPNRDLVSNFAVDLAKNLEDYLLKICSGEITSLDDDKICHPVNFAEAALLIQGSVQVYSRKVEYLYTLVLHALEFISQKKQDQTENATVQPDGSDTHTAVNEEDEIFLGLDDVPVEAKNCLDGRNSKDDALTGFVKPPANLLVLEGDRLDTANDAGELESYLLATTDLYRDFLLLDPCDAVVIDKFLEESSAGLEKNVPPRVSSMKSKGRKSYLQSPIGRSGGSANKSKFGNDQDNHSSTPPTNCCMDGNDIFDKPEFVRDNLENDEAEMDGGLSHQSDDSADDEDDPWKPLNPHEPGNLKIKPFKKGKRRARKVCSTKVNAVVQQFPVARLDKTVNPEFEEALERLHHAHEQPGTSHSLPCYEKLRNSLVFGESEVFNEFHDPTNEDQDNDFGGDFDTFEHDDLHDDSCMDAEANDEPTENNVDFNGNEDFGQDGPNSEANLEDLCRSHLEALLASVSKTEKQEELAVRVATWGQRTEHILEEENSRPPFDIHAYGDQVLNKLSGHANSGGCLSFADVVSGHAKYDVARTFSALLQLANNGDVDLDGGAFTSEHVCFTADQPFYVKLQRHDKMRERIQFQPSKKRVKSPFKKQNLKDQENISPTGGKHPAVSSSLGFTSPVKSSLSNGKFSIKVGKGNLIRCTPEGKRRRRSRLFQ